MECHVLENPEVLADCIAGFERRLQAQQAITLDEVKELEQRAQPFKQGPHYQLAQRVRRLAVRLGHVGLTQWEELKQAPAPVFNIGERAYIGQLEVTKNAPVEVKVVYDHLFLTTNYLATIGNFDLVKITHRFNREGRLDLIDARLKQTRRGQPDTSMDGPLAQEAIFHLVQTFAFKDKQADPGWSESRCEYFIRLRQIASVFYDLGIEEEEQQYRFILQRGHRLMRELQADVRAASLRNIRVVRPPFYPFNLIREDEAACYIIGKAAHVEPRVMFDKQRTGGHLGDLRIRYAAV